MLMMMMKVKNERKTKFLKMLLRNVPLLLWVDLDENKLAFKFSFCVIEEIAVLIPEHVKLAKKICAKYKRRNRCE